MTREEWELLAHDVKNRKVENSLKSTPITADVVFKFYRYGLSATMFKNIANGFAYGEMPILKRNKPPLTGLYLFRSFFDKGIACQPSAHRQCYWLLCVEHYRVLSWKYPSKPAPVLSLLYRMKKLFTI